METDEIDGEAMHDFEAIAYIEHVSDNNENLFETTLNSYGSKLEGGYNIELYIYDLILGYEVSRYRIISGCVNLYHHWIVWY